MHSSKRVDQPHGNSNSKPNYSWVEGKIRWSWCACGNKMIASSKVCRKCWRKNKRDGHTPVPKTVFYIDGERCRWIGVTQGQRTIVPATRFKELSRLSWHARKNRKYGFYVFAKVGNKHIQMHRYIMGFPPASKQVDHKNHNGLDNRYGNLRVCTQPQNSTNRGPNKGDSSKYKGVDWRKSEKMWVARIMKNRKSTFLGYFRNEKDAAKAYDEAASKLHGEFAWLNFHQ